MKTNENDYEIIVIGGGHAAIEAACASAHKGHATLMLVLDLDSIAYLACNPSIGGTSKGNLVKEIDALGGMQAQLADACLVQLRMLNAAKGVAVQSLRAQIDKYRYHHTAKRILETTPNLTLRQAEATEILSEDGKVTGVKTARGQTFSAECVIVCTGVYLNSHIIVGTHLMHQGPSGFARSEFLSDSIASLGHPLRRFKTGTPPRVDGKTVDFSVLEEQGGEDVSPFSAATDSVDYNGMSCWLGYTNEHTHEVIRSNLKRSALYGGLIHGTGARYCPSIEDKVVRFADKTRHQFFLEPESPKTDELYVQGLSTSMPADIQAEILHTVKGLEHVRIMRDAYAIEYDCIDSLSLRPSLESKHCNGLFFAGQINGTSGYEEAAAQGLVAGINAALTLERCEPMILTRADGYIGVLIDDLVTKGTNEPYRMMTSRAEYRLRLRQADSDLRLTPTGRAIGLVKDDQYARYQKKVDGIAAVRELLPTKLNAAVLSPFFARVGETYNGQGMTLEEVFKRGAVAPEQAVQMDILKDFEPDAVSTVLYDCKYAGYLAREEKDIAEARRLENMLIDENFDYCGVKGLRIEAAQKLSAVRPRSVGQAARISGVNPADITVLLMQLRTRREH